MFQKPHEISYDFVKRKILAERLVCVFGIAATICFLINLSMENEILVYIFSILGAITVACIILVYERNVSLEVCKALLKEVDVLVLLICSIARILINALYADEWIQSALYGILVLVFVSMDTLKVKSRLFTLMPATIFVTLTVTNLVNNIVTTMPVPDKVVIKSGPFVIGLNTLHRSIYTQILFFGCRGLLVLAFDTRMEKMIFATGPLYRSTGETTEVKKNEAYLCSRSDELGLTAVSNRGTRTRSMGIHRV